MQKSICILTLYLFMFQMLIHNSTLFLIQTLYMFLFCSLYITILGNAQHSIDEQARQNKNDRLFGYNIKLFLPPIEFPTHSVCLLSSVPAFSLIFSFSSTVCVSGLLPSMNVLFVALSRLFLDACVNVP